MQRSRKEEQPEEGGRKVVLKKTIKNINTIYQVSGIKNRHRICHTSTPTIIACTSSTFATSFPTTSSPRSWPIFLVVLLPGPDHSLLRAAAVCVLRNPWPRGSTTTLLVTLSRMNRAVTPTPTTATATTTALRFRHNRHVQIVSDGLPLLPKRRALHSIDNSLHSLHSLHSLLHAKSGAVANAQHAQWQLRHSAYHGDHGPW